MSKFVGFWGIIVLVMLFFGCSGSKSPLIVGCAFCPLCHLCPVDAAEPSCCGDCNNDGTVTVEEYNTVLAVNQGRANLSACPKADCRDADGNEGQDGVVTQEEVSAAAAGITLGCQ